jgi:hypothetical protein
LSETVAARELPDEKPSLGNPATCSALSEVAETASLILE